MKINLKAPDKVILKEWLVDMVSGSNYKKRGSKKVLVPTDIQLTDSKKVSYHVYIHVTHFPNEHTQFHICKFKCLMRSSKSVLDAITKAEEITLTYTQDLYDQLITILEQER